MALHDWSVEEDAAEIIVKDVFETMLLASLSSPSA